MVNVNALQDTEGRPGYEHVPKQPKFMTIIRGVQLLLALLILGLSAYAGSGVGFLFVGYSMAIFTFCWTILFLAYVLGTTLFYPKAYNMWAQLILEIFCVIFWLSAFASLAALAAVWSIGQDYVNTSCSVYDTNCYVKRYSYADYNSQANATKAAAALGAFEWVSFVATLILFSISLHRHRVAMRESQPPVFQEHKMENVQAPQQQYAQPTPQYSQPMDARYEQQTMA